MSRAWMPLYMADFLADTMHLDCTSTGAYMLLLMHMYQKGSLPEMDEQCRCIAKASPEIWSSIKPTIQEFFYDGWKHKRVEKELAKSTDLSEMRRAGAKKRWDAQAYAKKSENAQAYANDHAKGMVRARASQSQSHKEDSYLVEKGRKEANSHMNGQVFVKEDTEQWKAWAAHYRKSSGTGPPKTWSEADRTAVGWWFPSEWPPKMSPPLRSV